MERGMASTPKMEYQVFFAFSKRNQLWLHWDSQQGRFFSLPSQRNFPISFKPKVAIAEFFWKMQRKTWYSIFGVDAMPLSLKNLLLNKIGHCKNSWPGAHSYIPRNMTLSLELKPWTAKTNSRSKKYILKRCSATQLEW